ncbi:somatic embryogenesis receptor kinase 2-like isoform X2 [Gossypium raimondii]|uniref:somatic embryogenesis receptor kinase 2-like isoform X2 n=1 Tax=Gossypium raimondii TaxID=29730 RepID=UPI00063B026D|nr:somatic embryogenesis receptor kinase 2-like isoform X2 [Gossypium raimondii]
MAFSFYTCFAILLFSLSIAVRSSEITRATNNDSESLVAEEKALMETGWWSNYSDIGVHHCTWPGVRCSATGSVIEIDLSGHGRNGSITPQIGALFKLKCLNLSSNNLRGPILLSMDCNATEGHEADQQLQQTSIREGPGAPMAFLH